MMSPIKARRGEVIVGLSVHDAHGDSSDNSDFTASAWEHSEVLALKLHNLHMISHVVVRPLNIIFWMVTTCDNQPHKFISSRDRVLGFTRNEPQSSLAGWSDLLSTPMRCLRMKMEIKLDAGLDFMISSFCLMSFWFFLAIFQIYVMPSLCHGGATSNRVQPARGEMNTDQLISSAETQCKKMLKTAFDRFCFSDFGVGWLRRALYFELVYYLYYILHAYVTDIYILLHVAILSDPFGSAPSCPLHRGDLSETQALHPQGFEMPWCRLHHWNRSKQ